jgi:DNA processing protein
MIADLHGIATVLAATEILPAEWRDLSELLESCGGLECLLAQKQRHTSEPELLRYVRTTIDPNRVNHWVRYLDRLFLALPSLKVLLATQSGYPLNLRECYDHPPLIFINGAILPTDARALAIVGSRNPAAEGHAVARDVAMMAAEVGITIVSGLAQGVDTAAHRGALIAGGRTIAVLGYGIDHPIYPIQNADLATEIRNHGALISHFRPGSPPSKSSFVSRNAIISGLARVSFLVEAAERSGTRTEAEYAVRQERKVLLWEPVLGKEPWALWFAEQPGVEMVSDPHDVLSIVEGQS